MLSLTNSLCYIIKSDEDLGKVKDVTKHVEFESFKIRNVSDQKQFEAPDETDRVLQMHP